MSEGWTYREGEQVKHPGYYRANNGQRIRVICTDRPGEEEVSVIGFNDSGFFFIFDAYGKSYYGPCRRLVSRWYDLPGPGEWCTLQQWIDAGRDAEEFRVAYRANQHDGNVTQILMSKGWGRVWLNGPAKFNDPYDMYRIRLDKNGELPKPKPERPEWLPDGCVACDVLQFGNSHRLYAKIPPQVKPCYALSANEMPLHKMLTDSRLYGFAYKTKNGIEIRCEPMAYIFKTTGSLHSYIVQEEMDPIRPFAVVLREE